MAVAAFARSKNINSAEGGAAYDIFRTDDAPVSGHVFTDMGEHSVVVDGRVESRPAVVFRFFGLAVDGRALGNPRCTAKFHPWVVGRADASSMVSLGEPGFLTVQSSQLVTLALDDTAARLVTELIIAIATEFLTDERVARPRHWSADQRRLEALRVHEQAEHLEQEAFRGFLRARADADATYALLHSVRKPH